MVADTSLSCLQLFRPELAPGAGLRSSDAGPPAPPAAGEELTGLALLPEGQGLLALTGDCRALFLRPAVRANPKPEYGMHVALVSMHTSAVTPCAAPLEHPLHGPHDVPW